MQSVEERVGNLEERVVALEVAFHQLRKPRATARRTAPPPAERPKPASAPMPDVKQTPAVSQVPHSPAAPARPAPKPSRSFEAYFGGVLASRFGGIAVIVGIGFFLAYASKKGWIGPETRLALGSLLGVSLIGAGEWFHRKMAQFAAALTGSGIAVLYLCTFAGYAHYGFYGWPVAMLLAVLITVGGVAQAWRQKVEAIAALAAAGGFFAPVIIQFVHAEPIPVLGYVLLLNTGLTWLRWRTDWRATEWVAWIGTPVAMAVAMSDVGQVSIEVGLFFLLANVALFSLRPRLKPTASSPIYTIVLACATTTVSWWLFVQRSVDGWQWFMGGLALVTASSAWFGGRRQHTAAGADLAVATAMGGIAIFHGCSSWEITVGWSLLAAAVLWIPWHNLRRVAWLSGLVVASAAGLHLIVYEAHQVDHRLVAFVSVALAAASLRREQAYWSAVMIAACGIAAEVATARGTDPWMTLALLEPARSLPSTRLLVGGVLAAAIALFGGWRRNRRALQIAAAYGGMLVVADLLYAIDGIGMLPAGLVAAAVLVAVRPTKATILFVSAGLAVAAAFDLFPPTDFLPFLNRRTVAIGSVLAAGWWLLRGRPERPATVMMGILLLGAELASLPDRTGGSHAWQHLWLNLTTEPMPYAILNSRFLFLLGAAGAAFFASRRWSWMAVVGHVYLVVALGAEAVGLVNPGLRATPQAIFLNADAFMAEQLALTGVILVYGAGLVTAGIIKGHAITRRIGLGMLVAGAAKVSILDLVALGDLYRVGSFMVLGGTFLLGSYAYNRWVTGPDAAEGRPEPGQSVDG